MVTQKTENKKSNYGAAVIRVVTLKNRSLDVRHPFRMEHQANSVCNWSTYNV